MGILAARPPRPRTAAHSEACRAMPHPRGALGCLHAPADRRHGPGGLRAAAAPARRGYPGALPGAQPAPPGRAARARADRARRPHRPAFLSQRPAGRADTVVHLAASIRDQPRGSIEELNGIATWRMVHAAQRAGVERFVFFSVLDASTHHRARFFRAKALAEQAVRESRDALDGLRPLDRLRPRRSLADAAGTARAAAGRARLRAAGAPSTSRSGPRTSPTA